MAHDVYEVATGQVSAGKRESRFLSASRGASQTTACESSRRWVKFPKKARPGDKSPAAFEGIPSPRGKVGLPFRPSILIFAGLAFWSPREEFGKCSEVGARD
jgi:hypothetical protein